MPFILNNPTDDELKKKQSDAINISGASTVIDGNNSSNAAPVSAKASGSFTNLQDYLNANKEQASEMGSKIVGTVDNTANQAKSSLDNVSSSVKSVDAVNQDKLNTDYYNDPMKADKNSYTAIKTGYTGPKDLSQVNGYEDSIKDWQKASDSLKNASSESGRQQLLKDTYNRDQYSQGAQQLDQTLIQNNQDSKNQFEGLQNKWSGLSSMLDSTSQKVGDTIKSNLNQDKVNKDLIAQSEAKAQADLVNPIKQRADKYNAETPAMLAALNSGVNSNTFSQDALDKIGLADGTSLYGANLSDYYKQDATQANANSMATDAERSRYAALQSLLDGTGNDITADGKNITPYSINKEGLANKIAEGKAAYENAFNTEKIYGFGPNFDTAAQLMNYANTYPDSKDTPAILKAVAAQKARYGADKIIKKQ